MFVHLMTISSSPSFVYEFDEFIPKRWLPEPKHPIKHAHNDLSTIRAFGMSLRVCMGKQLTLAEMGLNLARLMWSFEISVAEEHRKTARLEGFEDIHAC